jgi:hypothetical protein
MSGTYLYPTLFPEISGGELIHCDSLYDPDLKKLCLSVGRREEIG